VRELYYHVCKCCGKEEIVRGLNKVKTSYSDWHTAILEAFPTPPFEEVVYEGEYSNNFEVSFSLSGKRYYCVIAYKDENDETEYTIEDIDLWERETKHKEV